MKTLTRTESFRLEILTVVLLLVGSFAIRFHLANLVHFDSDEAIQGLMAKHISEGHSFPIMEYGSSHHGAFASYLIALLYFVENSVDIPQLRLYAVVGWLLAAIPLYATVRNRFGRAASLFTLLFYCYPPMAVMETSLKAYPGQVETQFVTTVLLYAIFVLPSGRMLSVIWYLWMGMAMGFAIWLTPAAIPGMLCMIGILGYPLVRKACSSVQPILLLTIGLFIGYAPAITFHFLNQDLNIWTFLTHSDPTYRSVGDVFQTLFFQGYPSLLGIKVPLGSSFSDKLLGWVFYSLLIGMTLTIFWKSTQAKRDRNLLALCLSYFFVYTALLLIPRWNQSLEHSPRYLLPLFPILCLFCGMALSWRRREFLLWKVMLCVGFWVWLLGSYPSRCLLDEVTPDRLLVQEIQSYGVTDLLADYWKSYKLVFISNESLIVSPQAGPIVVDRYPLYTDRVYASATPAYLMIPDRYNGYSQAEQMDTFLRMHRYSFKMKEINELILFWDIQPKVLPKAIGLLRYGDTR